MKISQFKQHLSYLTSIDFRLENNTAIPAHFHITEAGIITKQFIDCGNTIRTAKKLSFQIWVAQDTNHRLTTSKLLKIIEKTEQLWGNEDLEIEVEYQTDTIGKYALDIRNDIFLLLHTNTACLAQDQCDITPKTKLNLADIGNKKPCCAPNDSIKCC